MYERMNKGSASIASEMRATKKNIARVLTEIRKKEIEILAKECQDQEFKPIVIRNLRVQQGKQIVGGKKTKAQRLALTQSQKDRRSLHCNSKKHGHR